MLIFCCDAHADNGAVADAHERAQFVFAGMRQERERLSRSVYTAHGTRHCKDREGEYDVPLKVFCAFDESLKSFRFDREELFPVDRTPLPVPLQKNQTVPAPKVLRFGSTERAFQSSNIKLYRKADHCAYFRSGELSIQKLPPDREAPFLSNPFDVRAVGLFNRFSLDRGDAFNDLADRILSRLPDEAVDETQGIVRLVWRLPKDHRRVMWIDETKGFGIIRSEVQAKDGHDPTGWGAPLSVNSVTWKRMSEVWVPDTFAFECRTAYGRGPVNEGINVCRYTYAFDWQQVNGPVSNAYFTVEDFQAPRNTLIINSLGPNPIAEKLVGVTDFTPTELDPAPIPVEDLPPTRWRLWLIVVNAVVVCALAVAVWRRHRPAPVA